MEDEALKALLEASWPDRTVAGVATAQLAHSLAYVCAFAGERLVGFVNIAWDGAQHGFVLDTTALPAYRRLGLGTRLRRCAQ